MENVSAVHLIAAIADNSIRSSYRTKLGAFITLQYRKRACPQPHDARKWNTKPKTRLIASEIQTSFGRPRGARQLEFNIRRNVCNDSAEQDKKRAEGDLFEVTRLDLQI